MNQHCINRIENLALHNNYQSTKFILISNLKSTAIHYRIVTE